MNDQNMNSKEYTTGSNHEKRIQGSYDELDGDAAFVIADVTTDDAWLAIAAGDEVEVGENR